MQAKNLAIAIWQPWGSLPSMSECYCYYTTAERMGNGTEINGGGTERQTDCQSRERITSGENTLAGIISGLGQKVCCNETGTSHIIVWIKD